MGTNPTVHTNYLHGSRLLWAVTVLNVANAAAFIDLLGGTAILTKIGKDLHAVDTIGWATTSQLIAATVGQCIFGYLSDVYGRRNMIVLSMVLLSLGALGCGFCSFGVRAMPFFICRAVTGIACGSISNLANIAQNDYLPPERRPKYQGIQGVSVAAGSAIGQIGGAALALMRSSPTTGWPLLYWMESGLAAIIAVLVAVRVPAAPLPPTEATAWVRLKSFDWVGTLSGTGVIAPGLLLLTEGSKFGWSSRTSIGLFITLGICFIAFLCCGISEPLTRSGVRPIVPFKLFRNATLSAIYLQNVFFGAAFWTFLLVFGLYWQNVRDTSALTAALCMLPYILTHGLWSSLSPQLIKFCTGNSKVDAKGFRGIATFGFTVWTTGMLLLALLSPDTHMAGILAASTLVGFGTGSVSQNSVNAIRSQVDALDQAVAIGTRNVLRYFGGAVGTAVSSAIMRKVLVAMLAGHLDSHADNIFSKPDLRYFSASDKASMHTAYRKSIEWVFIFAAVATGVCLLGCVFIKDRIPAEKTVSDTSSANELELLDHRRDSAVA